jgi:N-acetylglutamate synthase-like GNAT family acetyltransferase
MHIRQTHPKDIPSLQSVIDETGLFPSEMLPDMIEGFFSGDEHQSLWLTCEKDEEIIGFCYAIPEQLTNGTWNMLAIAVHPLKQGGGVGSTIVKHLESALHQRGHRVLIAETSGTDVFSTTRAFYRKNHYTEEARIRDFWAEGDDKIVFWKRLG